MKQLRLIAILAAATATALLLSPPGAARAEDATIVASPNAVKWGPGPQPGTQFAVLYGNPKDEGPLAFRGKFPAGSRIMPHTHPHEHNLTVISGTLHIGFGDKFDPAKGTTIQTGGFVHVPAGTPHYVWFTTPTVLQDVSVGPFVTNFANPADAPAKTQ